MTVARALELKGIQYKRVELPELGHIPHQRLRFGGRSVPSVKFDDGSKELGSRRILRVLDERVPEPPLLPADPELRARVLELEEWGDEFQGVPRRLIFWGLRRTPSAFPSYAEGSRWRMPAAVSRVVGPSVARMVMRVHDASDETTEADIEALPGHLARIESAIEEGVLGGEQPNAADLQLAPSVRLLLTLEDVRPLVEAGRAGDWARGLFPDVPGSLPAGTFPAGRVPV
jgi:glutathione S-transferase